jgi:MinD-like ATPase involved in chromosome partitioning or flagellar assembly
MSAQAATLASFVRAQPRERGTLPHVITIACGKGGSGASTVAAMAALGAQQFELPRITLVDADESLGSLHMLLGFRRPDVSGVVSRRLSPNVQLTGLGMAAVHETPAALRVEFQRIGAEYRNADLVLIDAGSRAAAVRAAIAAGSARIVLVTTVDAVALASTYALMKLAAGWRDDLRFDVLVNGADAAQGVHAFSVIECATRDFLGTTPTLMGTIPQHDNYGQTIFADALSSELRDDHPFMATSRALAQYIVPGSRRAN